MHTGGKTLVFLFSSPRLFVRCDQMLLIDVRSRKLAFCFCLYKEKKNSAMKFFNISPTQLFSSSRNVLPIANACIEVATTLVLCRLIQCIACTFIPTFSHGAKGHRSKQARFPFEVFPCFDCNSGAANFSCNVTTTNPTHHRHHHHHNSYYHSA